jgi:CDP-paratose 2-epimerase
MVIVTGSGGLIGSAAARSFAADGKVLGIDNDMRSVFFGANASTRPTVDALRDLPNYQHQDCDIRDRGYLNGMFALLGPHMTAVIHCAAQPSHDWAASDPFADFDINAVGTLNLLEMTRRYAPGAAFVFMSTNKVYGDEPRKHHGLSCYDYFGDDPNEGAICIAKMKAGDDGIGEKFSIDQTTHSIFGASKLAADIMVQEYGRYFGMNTVCFRGGCLTGRAHAGAEQHGFLAYLCKCAREGIPYTVYGYGGKQVRDNIHAEDVVSAMRAYIADPEPGAVYNIGGGPANAVSVLEAIAKAEALTGNKMDVTFVDEPRKGDHKWWVTDMTKFRQRYPGWQIQWDLNRIFEELCRG